VGFILLTVNALTLEFHWHRFIKTDGDCLTIDRFGASAPGPVCLEKFGFTVDNVVAKAKALG
jgi:transketolase